MTHVTTGRSDNHMHPETSAELSRLQPTIGYLSLSEYPVERIAKILVQKLSN